ncbi:MAG: ABC transporter ATP-binding protein [Hyphomicrobiales bacterium]
MTDDPLSSDFIQINDVRKQFGPVVALEKIDLKIAEGEFFSLLGPSGCGKTTLLRILSGLEFPTSGSVVIDGSDVSREPPYRRPTNLVFQSYAIFPHLSVAENIAYGLRRLRLGSAEQARRVDDMLALIGLQGFGSRKPNQLSGGQLQRVALARALVLKPKVLLLDEPLAALDKKLRERMQLELRALQREVGITFVFVTHDQEEALTLSDRVAVMSQGRMVQCSTPLELYERPQNRFVAEFVGEMNFFSGRVVESSGDGYRVELVGLGTVTCPGKPRYEKGDAVVVAARPEWVRINSSSKGEWKGRVLERQYFGERCHIQVQLKSCGYSVVASVRDPIPNLSDDVGVCIDFSRSVLLREDTGDRRSV